MQRILKIVLFFYFIVFVPFPASAQANGNRFEHVSIEQGLSNFSVFSIVQDSIGFMWFATEDGLNRYDGYTCRIYRHLPNDSNSIASSVVKKLFVDAKGRFWIITQNGDLDRYLFQKDRFLHYKFYRKDRRLKVSTITQDRQGRVFLGTKTGRLFYYQAAQDTFLSIPISRNPAKPFHLHTMYADRLGRIWLGTFEGLFRYDPAEGCILSMSETGGPDFGMVLDMAGDQQGRIRIASTGNGLFCFDSGKKRFFHYKKDEKNSHGLNSNRITSVLMDSNGNLWVGTVDRGLNVWFAGTDRFAHYVHDLSDNRSVVNGAIFAIYEDKNGGIWIGSYGGGVCRYDPHQPPFHQITHRPHERSGLSSNIVLSICEDHQGKLWVGTDGGGLNVLEPESNSFRHYFRQAGEKSSNSITALIETSDETLWLGMDVGGQMPGGLIYRFNRSLKRFERFELIRPKFGGVSVFMEDHLGRLWIGTFAEGLYCYDRHTDQVKHFVFDKRKSQGLSGNSILSLQGDDSGQIWIGTLNRGLDRYNPMTGKFTHFESQSDNPNSLCGNSVFSMAKDNEGRLWFGTNGGLNGRLADNDAFFSLTTTDGLPGNLIYGILSDSAGQLWLSTNRGLVCFNPKTGAIKKYGPTDGLLNFEFTQGAYCKGRNGTLYFGGNKGLTYFNPYEFKENHYEPPVVLTDFLVKGKKFKLKNSILFTKRIVLSYRQNFFSFKFAALDYRASGKNEYAYRLTGVDDDWVYCGHRRFADYTDIAPGEYVFEAKATNSDGIWGQKRATVELIILPPFWQTWWFRFLAFLALAAMLFAAHSYRLNKKLEVERTRLRIARDLHDDVSATITGIAYFTEALERQVAEHKTPGLEKLFTLIRESVRNVQDSMSDIIWAIKPENDRWETFFPKLRRFASEICESKGIDYAIEMPQTVPVKELEMEMRRNIWLIFKETITNSVKHSSCKQMKIWVRAEKNHLLLHIEDDGKGFDPHEHSVGNGLANIYRRCQALKGKAELRTAPGKGVSWEINLPL